MSLGISSAADASKRWPVQDLFQKEQTFQEFFQRAPKEGLVEASDLFKESANGRYPLALLGQAAEQSFDQFVERFESHEVVFRRLFHQDQFPVSQVEGTDLLPVKTQPSQPKEEAPLPDLVSPPPAVLAQDPKKAKAPSQSQAPAEGVLRLIVGQNGVRVEPGRLYFEKPGAGISVKVERSSRSQGEAFSLFVRDRSLVRWEAGNARLVGLNEGQSEVYIVTPDQMLIVPVRIGEGDFPKLAVPETLLSLSDVLRPQEFGSYNGHGSLGADLGGYSLSDSEAEVAREQEELDLAGPQYGRLLAKAEFTPMQLQLVDDRSRPELKKVFPAKGVTVNILGTEYSAKTDGTGLVLLKDVPNTGRFMVKAVDEQGRYLSTVTEITPQERTSQGLVRVRLMREEIFNVLTFQSRTAQDQALASFCGRLLDDGKPRSGVSVRIGNRFEADDKALEPLYFAQGIPDREMAATGDDGRFCFFNIEPGLAEVDFYEGDLYSQSMAIPLIGGSHLDQDLAYDSSHAVKVAINLGPTAGEELELSDLSASYRRLDYANLIAVGENEPFIFKRDGLLEAPEASMPYNGRLYAIASKEEFEPILYSLNALQNNGSSAQVVRSLLPKGYLDDLYYQLVQENGYDAQPYESDKGSLLIDFGHPEGFEEEPVHFKVMDLGGNEMKNAWYYGNQEAVTKAVYFNLEPGIYTVLVLSDQGQWIDVETTAVEYDTVSLIQRGSPVVKNP